MGRNINMGCFRDGQGSRLRLLSSVLKHSNYFVLAKLRILVVHDALSRSRAILHEVDRYIFLILCPILLIFQILLLKIYYDNPVLRYKQGLLFMFIVIY